MPTELLVPVVGVFLAMAFVFGAIVMLVLQRTSVEQKRLRAVSASSAPTLVLEQTQLVEALDPRLQKLSKAMPRSPKDMMRLRKHLAAAGYYSFGAAVAYSLAELVLPLILGGALCTGSGGRTVGCLPGWPRSWATFSPACGCSTRQRSGERQFRTVCLTHSTCSSSAWRQGRGWTRPS